MDASFLNRYSGEIRLNALHVRENAIVEGRRSRLPRGRKTQYGGKYRKSRTHVPADLARLVAANARRFHASQSDARRGYRYLRKACQTTQTSATAITT